MKALYIGSFDPFTIGHYEVLKQAEELFDKVYVYVSNNPQKKRRFSTISCAWAIKQIPDLKDSTKENIGETDDILTTDLMRELDCNYLVRGLRNTSDYLYEEQLLQMYKELDRTIKVVYLRASNNISSTFVYELYKRNLPIQRYLPYPVDLLGEGW